MRSPIIKNFRRYFIFIQIIFGTYSGGSLTYANVKINLAAGARSQNIVHGAPIWSGGAAFIGPGFVFYDHWYLNGPSLKYEHFDRTNQHQLSLGVSYFDDGKPMIALDSTKESYRNERVDSWPLRLVYRFRFGERNRFSVGMDIEKELFEYKGESIQVNGSVPLFPFVSFHISQNIMSKASAHYFYGNEAKSSYGYTKMGIGLFLPFGPFGSRVIGSLDQYIINQGVNRHSYFIRGDYKNLSSSLLFLWSLR